MQTEQHTPDIPSFRLDVPLHTLLTRPTSPSPGLQPVGDPQKFPDPNFSSTSGVVGAGGDGRWLDSPGKAQVDSRTGLPDDTRLAVPVHPFACHRRRFHPLIAYLSQSSSAISIAITGPSLFHQLARGGERYMEVGKNVYYTVNHLCHMVLALKPFGCMPSMQSDDIQLRVVNKYKDMIFLPIETSGEGEVNAHSRVQMAMAEAKAKARARNSKAF